MIRQQDSKKRGKAARNKGANAERELARLIHDMWGYDLHRGKVFYGESDIVGLEGIHIEVKRQERINIHQAMEQAVTTEHGNDERKKCIFDLYELGNYCGEPS